LQMPGPVTVDIDPLRIEQVVTNLVDNAIKYSPDGGQIDVELSVESSESVRLAVRDHGIGIPPEHRSRIFSRFYQAHPNQHFGGIGLGLHISRQIIEQHGGKINVEFPPDGSTQFIVILPANKAD
jgi:signal transduction histidine kinase